MSTPTDLVVWPGEALAIIACLVSVVIDLRTRRIPNLVTGAAAGSAICLHGALVLFGLAAQHVFVWSLVGGLVGLLVFALLSMRGLVGFGDTKLIFALGLCLGFPAILRVLIYTMLAGGLVSLAHGAFSGQLGSALANLKQGHRLGRAPIDEPGHQLHAMPYASAIALGTLWTILARHVPPLALL